MEIENKTRKLYHRKVNQIDKEVSDLLQFKISRELIHEIAIVFPDFEHTQLSGVISEQLKQHLK